VQPGKSASVSSACAGALRTKGQESTLTVNRKASDQQEGIMTRKISLIAATFVVATGLFGAWTVTSPSVSEAAINPGIDVGQIEFNASKNLPSFDDKYQRHIGVLDTFAAS
jgi:hypothetical protein